MNKAEFMKELERLLQNIPDNEREEALNYYEEYFNDAGEENEQKVLAELESPQKVADKIKDGLRADMDFRDTMGNGNNAWQSGSAYQNGTCYQGSTIYQGNNFYQNGSDAAQAKEKEGIPTWAIVLIVIGCILLSPAILGAAGTLLGVLAGLFFGFFGLILGFGGAGLGLVVAGIITVVVGLVNIAVLPFAGVALAGAGLLLLAIGILCVMFAIWLCGYAAPAICRGIKWLWNKIFDKDK